MPVWQESSREGKGVRCPLESSARPVRTVLVHRGASSIRCGLRIPEELLGAAHAACFSMAFSGQLAGEKLTAERIATTATVTIDKVDGGFGITHVHLAMEARIAGADQATFDRLAAAAKAGCPVSKLFNTKITLDAKLVG